jgi:putative transposase
MPVKPDFDPANLYFITTTAVNRAHLFQRDINKRIVVDSLSFMRVNKWLRLHVFAIMPNHVHVIVRFLGDHRLPDVMRDFKKHTAKQIIRQYQGEGNHRALGFLEQAARDAGDQSYKIWEDGYDARDVYSRGFLRQKTEYVHQNPCQPHWALVERAEEYPWSSARYYLLGLPAIIAVDDVSEWLA